MDGMLNWFSGSGGRRPGRYNPDNVQEQPPSAEHPPTSDDKAAGAVQRQSADFREPDPNDESLRSSGRRSGTSTPTSGRRSGKVAGIHATLVPTGWGRWGRPHMIESMGQGGPAHASGMVQPGDLLLEVDGVDVSDLPLNQIQEKIVGPVGTQVTLTLQRGEKNFAHKVSLTRKPRGMYPSPRVASKAKAVIQPEIREGQKELQPTTPRSAPTSARGVRPEERDYVRPQEPSVDDRFRETSAHYSKHMRPRSDDVAPMDVPRPVGVPPLFRNPRVGGSEQARMASPQEESEEDETIRDQELSARADYWKDQYSVLEKATSAGDQGLRKKIAELERNLREVEGQAEEDKNLFKRTIQHLEERQRSAEEALSKGAADEELKKRLRHMEQVLEETKKQCRKEEQARKEAEDALRDLQAEEGVVRKHLEQKLKKSDQQLSDLRMQMDELRHQNQQESRSYAPSHVQPTPSDDDAGRELKMLRGKVLDLETRLAAAREDEQALITRSSQLQASVQRLEKELSDNNLKREAAEQEARELARELEEERKHGDEHMRSLEGQLKKLTGKLDEASHGKADAEKRCAKLEAELNDTEAEAQDTIVKLRKKLELLEDREGNTGSALSKTRAALEHAQTDVARLERELDAWKVKSEQAEARRQQLETLLKRKEEELERAYADGVAERVAKKQALEEADAVRHRLEAQAEAERERRREEEGRLREAEREAEAAEGGRKKAEAALEELKGRMTELKSGAQALGARAEEAEAQLGLVEGQRERAAAEAAMLRAQTSMTQTESMLAARAAEDAAERLKQELRATQAEVESERREKLENLRELTDLKGEKRRADRLQRKLQELEERAEKERKAYQEVQEELEQTQSYADSVTEWDRGLREKVQKLEARLERSESSLTDEKKTLKAAEESKRLLEEDLAATAKMLAAANAQSGELQAKADDLAGKLSKEEAKAVLLNQAMEALALDHKRKGEQIEDLEASLEQLQDEFDKERNEARNSMVLSTNAERELGMLKRNLARAEEIIDEERGMRRELQDALERASEQHIHHHHHDSPQDITELQQEMYRLEEEREQALREAMEAKTALRESMAAQNALVVSAAAKEAVRTSSAGSNQDRILSWSEEAQEALLFANSEIRRLEDEMEEARRQQDEEVEAVRRASRAELESVRREVMDEIETRASESMEKQRGAADRAVRQLGDRVRELEQDNAQLQADNQQLQKEVESRVRASLEEQMSASDRAVRQLGERVKELEYGNLQLQQDNELLQQALSQKSSRERGSGEELAQARMSEERALARADAMEAKMESLIALQNKHQDSIAIRLQHALQDNADAIQRAERAESLLLERETMLAELRKQVKNEGGGNNGRLVRAR